MRIGRDKALATGQVIPCYENNPSGDTTRLSVTTGPLNTDMYSSQERERRGESAALRYERAIKTCGFETP